MVDSCVSYEEEDTCVSYEEEDTCKSYEEEDTCVSYEHLRNALSTRLPAGLPHPKEPPTRSAKDRMQRERERERERSLLTIK